jgi:hypothetical protein
MFSWSIRSAKHGKNGNNFWPTPKSDQI